MSAAIVTMKASDIPAACQILQKGQIKFDSMTLRTTVVAIPTEK